jgi:hypothetical protein
MLKSLLLGAAISLAMPALAQTVGSAPPDANKPGAPSNGGMTMGTTSPGQTTGSTAGATGSSTDSGWGTTGSSATISTMTGDASTTARGSGSWSRGSSAYAGRGGPMEAGKSYPACSRALRDNCTQRGGRSHRAAHHRGR